MKFLDEHTTTHSNLYWIGVGLYLAFAFAVTVVLCISKGYAETDDEAWIVWIFWFIYIVLYMSAVALIFGLIVPKLDKSEIYGPNFLKIMLCTAPALLVLVLQLAISPAYRKDVLSLSVFAALNLFDAIEMLEIVLMQNEREESVEKSIVVFACFSFVLTSLGLARNKFDGDDTVQERSNPKAVCLGLCAILFTNVPFLVLRIYVWDAYGYEASIFIAKNIVSLVVGLVEFCLACKCCTCE